MIRSAIETLGVRGGTVAGALAFNLFVARALSLSEAGVVFLLLAWLGIVSIPARLGLDGSMLVHFANLFQTSSAKLAGPLMARLAAAVAGAAVLGCGVIYVAVDLGIQASGASLSSLGLFVGAASVIPYSLTVANTALHKSLGQFRTANLIEGGGAVALAFLPCLVWLALGKSLDLPFMMFSILVGNCLMMVASLVLSSRSFSAAFDVAEGELTSPPSVRAIVKDSVSFVGAAMLAYLLVWLPGLSMGLAGRLEDVSRFNAIARLGALVVFGLSAANVRAAPSIARMYMNGDHAKLQQLAWQVARFSSVLGFVVFVASIAFGPLVMGAFGEDYAVSSIGLAIYCLGQFVNTFTGASAYLLQLTGSAGTLLKLLAVSFGTCGVAGALAGAAWGLIPAVVGTSAAVAMYNLLVRRAVRQRVGIDSNPQWFSALVSRAFRLSR